MDCRECGAPGSLDLAATKVGSSMPHGIGGKWNCRNRRQEASKINSHSISFCVSSRQHSSYTIANTTVMVGHLNSARQGQLAKLQPDLDYDVLIIGAGQVCRLRIHETRTILKAHTLLRVECIHCLECANSVLQPKSLRLDQEKEAHGFGKQQ